MKNHERTLPEEYALCAVIDVNDKRTAYAFNIVSYIIIIVISLFCLFLKKPQFIFDGSPQTLMHIGSYMILMLVYLYVHELIHGVVMKLYTKEKLTFRFGLTTAFCGVANVYHKKWPMIIATIMPFMILTPLLILLVIILPNNIWSLITIVLFGVHLASSISDLYAAYLVLTMPKDVLVLNDGMRYAFYQKK